jgi:hypothetical protein
VASRHDTNVGGDRFGVASQDIGDDDRGERISETLPEERRRGVPANLDLRECV